jgi:hypothetical protein
MVILSEVHHSAKGQGVFATADISSRNFENELTSSIPFHLLLHWPPENIWEIEGCKFT